MATGAFNGDLERHINDAAALLHEYVSAPNFLGESFG
jgi:hypothetical protein